MEQRKRCLSSPSLQDSSHAACHPVGAAYRGSLVHSRGVPIDRLASRRCSPPPTRVAPGPDCLGSRHLLAAWRAASAAAGHADTIPSRSSSDPQLADTAESPRRTRHTAALSSMRIRPANLGESATDQPLTIWSPTQGRDGSIRRKQLHWVHFPSTRWVNSRERQGIERCFNKLKHFRRLATRYDRRACHFLAFLCLAGAMLWMR